MWHTLGVIDMNFSRSLQEIAGLVPLKAKLQNIPAVGKEVALAFNKTKVPWLKKIIIVFPVKHNKKL